MATRIATLQPSILVSPGRRASRAMHTEKKISLVPMQGQCKILQRLKDLKDLSQKAPIVGRETSFSLKRIHPIENLTVI